MRQMVNMTPGQTVLCVLFGLNSHLLPNSILPMTCSSICSSIKPSSPSMCLLPSQTITQKHYGNFCLVTPDHPTLWKKSYPLLCLWSFNLMFPFKLILGRMEEEEEDGGGGEGTDIGRFQIPSSPMPVPSKHAIMPTNLPNPNPTNHLCVGTCHQLLPPSVPAFRQTEHLGYSCALTTPLAQGTRDICPHHETFHYYCPCMPFVSTCVPASTTTGPDCMCCCALPQDLGSLDMETGTGGLGTAYAMSTDPSGNSALPVIEFHVWFLPQTFFLPTPAPI